MPSFDNTIVRHHLTAVHPEYHFVMLTSIGRRAARSPDKAVPSPLELDVLH